MLVTSVLMYKRLSRECVYWKAIITTQRYLGLGGGGEGKKSPRYCNKFNEKARCPDASERAFSLNLLRCLWGMGVGVASYIYMYMCDL